MRRTRSTLVALALGSLAVAYAVTATGNAATDDNVAPPQMTAEANMARRPVTENDPSRQPAMETKNTRRRTSAPASLAGTDPDGDLAITVSRGTIRFFDYYLTTLGETDLAGVRALVATEVERQSPDTATEVLALFDHYVAYLQDLQGVHASTLDSYFAQVLALQQRHFGSDAELLFGDDNALAARLLAATSTGVP